MWTFCFFLFGFSLDVEEDTLICFFLLSLILHSVNRQSIADGGSGLTVAFFSWTSDEMGRGRMA